MPTCPYCGSTHVQKAVGTGMLGVVFFLMGSFFTFIGLFLWPVLLIGLLFFVLAVLTWMGVAIPGVRKAVANKWVCMACRKSFELELTARRQ